MKPLVKHCAIYTRKSTEEGLEQDFNTLDAQREACVSFISSQKAEGWIALPDFYDDGGYSGGNIERPALQKLLTDIKAGKINTVVVYKIDRLTRSLIDFSKLVEIFDQYGVTFVSITQSFNTTTSMGRLTLNVLLSFAQFEREVIGERVRDKIAASKKKGMWMGGNNPVGYGRVGKNLVPKEDEASFVTMIFKRYITLGNVKNLMLELKNKNIVSPSWVSSKGKQHGGAPYSRGALYAILSNPVYIGKIRHKGKVYNGLHEAIISQDLWDRVQTKLKKSRANHSVWRKQGCLLTGKLFDSEGTLYSPSHTNKAGKRYRYYVSQNLLQYRDHPNGLLARLPASEIEDLVRKTVSDQFLKPETIAAMLDVDAVKNYDPIAHISAHRQNIDLDGIIATAIRKIALSQDTLKITINSAMLAATLKQRFDVTLPDVSDELVYDCIIPYIASRSKSGAVRIDGIHEKLSRNDPFNRPEHEIQKWVKGVAWRDTYFGGKTLDEIASAEKTDSRYVARLINESLTII